MLRLIILTLSIFGGVSTALLTELSFWWAILFIPGYYIALTALYFILLYISSLCLPREVGETSSRFCRFMSWFTMEFLMSLLRIKVILTGKELLPNEPCIIASNHRSDFDPMTAVSVFSKRQLIYISKEGNFRIPIVGRYIRRAGYYPIDRENGMRALRTLKEAAERMKREHLDIGIYPEGTRSKTGELLEFKTGAFYLAKKAEAPVVLMTTVGTERIRPLLGTTVRLDILEVIPKERVMADSLEDLSAYARNVIEKHLEKIDGTVNK